MWMRVPVVAARTGGVLDLVSDGETGLLVPPRDPAALASALDRLLADAALARRLAEREHERASAYDWSLLARRVLDVYERVRGGRRTAS